MTVVQIGLGVAVLAIVVGIGVWLCLGEDRQLTPREGIGYGLVISFLLWAAIAGAFL